MARPERKNEGPEPYSVFVHSHAQLAWIFGVAVKTIGVWVRDGAPPKTDRGYSLRDWFAWRAGRQVGQNNGHQDAGLAADRRLKEAKAQREEVKLARERDELIDAEESQRRRLGILKLCTGIMDRAGSELTPLVAGKKPGEVKRIVARYFRDRRREIVDGK